MFQKKLSTKNKFLATILAFAVIPISGLATDIYLPSMPEMAIKLGLPETKIQLTLSLFLISYGICQFFIGTIADAFGRYRLSIVSLFLFVISFYWTAHTESIYVIYFNRILQGALAGCAVVSKRAFFVDVYEGDQRKHYLSVMTIVWSLAPIIAPFIGGYLQTHFGWESNFKILAVYAAILLILELLFSGETLKERKAFHMPSLAKEFKLMFETKDFFYGMLMCGISYGLVMFYNLSGPFIIEHQLRYSAVVTGYASLIMGLAWMSGGFIGRAMIKTAFLPKIRNANFIQLILVVIMFVSSYWISDLYTLVAFAFFIHLTAGFIFNNYFSYCLGRFPQSAGIAGGLTGGVAFVLTSLLSYAVVALLHPYTQQELSIGYFIIAVLGLIVLSVVKAKKLHS